MKLFTEDFLELAAIEILEDLGYRFYPGVDLSIEGSDEQRANYNDVLLNNKIKEHLTRLNQGLPLSALEEAYRKVKSITSPSLVESNRDFHKQLIEGFDVTFRKGELLKTEKANLIDFDNPNNNEFLVVSQLTIIEKEQRRPDLILFVNGIPLVVIELKSASNENVGIQEAYNQIQTYKEDIKTLFVYNAFCVLSDGINAKVGTITSNEERYMNWRTIDGKNIASLDEPQYEVMLRGMLNKKTLLDLVKNYVLFHENEEDIVDNNGEVVGVNKSLAKIISAYHQYFAVKKAIAKTEDIIYESNNQRIGVIWHTQGSGKSLTMVWYTVQAIQKFSNPTIVIVTDRNDLDDQLFKTFGHSKDALRDEPKQADVRKKTPNTPNNQNGLFDLLNGVQSGGIIFTTIQKFKPESGDMPVLSNRKNIIIIADEAHRSQYGLQAKTDPKTGEVSYGYAKYIRDALPNASFIGFTGTPIETEDKSTYGIFGNVIDTYDMTRSVEDKSTVKIYYENRIIKLDIDEEEFKKIDADIEEIFVGYEDEIKETTKKAYSRLEAVVGSPNRIKLLAHDIINHYEKKTETLKGKAMIVAMSRPIAVDLYDAITKERPDWHSEQLDKGLIKVMMTGAASDPKEIQTHVGGKIRKDTLAKRFKDPDDELKIIIVVDMWLTGFDVPSLHTMYVDKPMKGHNLMQAIARVNRVFKDKPGGTIVDYIGILESMKRALNEYTDSDKGNIGIDISKVERLLEMNLEILNDFMHGFDYQDYFGKSQSARIRAITGGMNHVFGKSEEEQKKFKDTVVNMARAHSLCAASSFGIEVTLEASYFKAVKASMMKIASPPKYSKAEVKRRITQMLEKSLISSEVIDLFDAAGFERPDISILDEKFLKEIQNMKHKNLALEMLKKLLEGNIHSLERINIVKSEHFSEKLKRTLNKYKNQALTNAEVVEELIELAKEIKTNREEEKKLGLSDEELAFYDALGSDGVKEQYKDDKILKQIAQELTAAINANKTIDWNVKKSAQAKMRSIIKRLLKKYDYPPKKTKHAMEIVMRQVNLMSEID
jgi:type I restriction enzyme, R subunit